MPVQARPSYQSPLRGDSEKTDSTLHVSRIVFDVALVASLVVALAVVYSVDRTSVPGAPSTAVSVTESERTVSDSSPAAPMLRLAVTEPLFDDMGQLLDEFGKGYKYKTIPVNDLIDPRTYSQYDIIFVTCSGVPDEWVAEDIGATSRQMTLIKPKPKVISQLVNLMREFVGEGGTLYFSDLHFAIVAAAFSEFVDQDAADEGQVQSVVARVVDGRLREAVDTSSLKLDFDQPGWKVAAFAGHGVETMLDGEYTNVAGRKRVGPLLVRFPLGKGTVVFTSFHNEKQNSTVELKLLKFLVFATVSARSEASMRETMVKGGFSPKRSSLLSSSADEMTLTKTYNCQDTGPLSFSLAFESQGALLELVVVDPDGIRHVKEGSAAFRLELNHGKVGEWKYTVTAKRVPYENFPFSLTVWSK